MGEVLFYRGLIFTILILLLAVVYKIVYPWVKAACVKMELEGEEVLKKAEREEDRPGKTESPGKGGEQEEPGDEKWSGVHEVSAAAKEAKQVLKKSKKQAMW